MNRWATCVSDIENIWRKFSKIWWGFFILFFFFLILGGMGIWQNDWITTLDACILARNACFEFQLIHSWPTFLFMNVMGGSRQSLKYLCPSWMELGASAHDPADARAVSFCLPIKWKCIPIHIHMFLKLGNSCVGHRHTIFLHKKNSTYTLLGVP